CLAFGIAAATAPAASRNTTIALVAYSTPKEAFAKIIPAFQATPAGRGVAFTQSYGPSGDQAQAIVAGLPADVVDLSLQPDLDTLVKAGLVDKNWDKNAYHGIVTRSVVVFVVRQGNPKHIKGWDDLVKPGVEVLTPNPFTSGGARWNVMAAYGAQIQQGRSEAQAEAYLQKLFTHVVVQDKSAREALQNFTAGKGEVLDYVLPDATILIENPIAALKKAGPKAKAFIDFATSEPAQRIFAAKGYRSVIGTLVDKQKYPDPPHEFDIAKFGGWDVVM